MCWAIAQDVSNFTSRVETKKINNSCNIPRNIFPRFSNIDFFPLLHWMIAELLIWFNLILEHISLYWAHKSLLMLSYYFEVWRFKEITGWENIVQLKFIFNAFWIQLEIIVELVWKMIHKSIIMSFTDYYFLILKG